jgi:hypothetical protein
VPRDVLDVKSGEQDILGRNFYFKWIRITDAVNKLLQRNARFEQSHATLVDDQAQSQSTKIPRGSTLLNKK